MSSIRLGVDFGTTTTVISLRVDDQLAEALPIGKQGALYMPSVVYIPPHAPASTARILVGEDAENSAVSGYVVHSVKRCLGCPGGDRCRDSRANGCGWCEGDGLIHLSGVQPLRPEHIVYLILREALERAVRVARTQYDVDLSKSDLSIYPINLGCGAAFDMVQRGLLMWAAHSVGLKQLSWDNIVEEPILAGFAFSRFATATSGRVLIYDFGGGSFDAAILDIHRDGANPNISVLATAGENWLGGDDIDGLVRQHFIGQIAQQLNLDNSEVEAKLEPVDTWRLRLFSKRAKEALTEDDAFENALFTDNLGSPILRLARSELESLILNSTVSIGNLLDRSLRTVLRACKLVYAMSVAQESILLNTEKIVKYSLEDAAQMIDQVVLVGGVTKMPLIRNRLASVFGIQKITAESVIEPVTAVAIGAAYPRDPQHYSLAYPPYEFVLHLRRDMGSQVELREVFLPYEHYRFHEEWAWNSVPAHRAKMIDLPYDFEFSSLSCRRIGTKLWTWHELERMQTGKWEFIAELDGTISVSYERGPRKELFKHPSAHPLQVAIRQARDTRMAKAKEDSDQAMIARMERDYYTD